MLDHHIMCKISHAFLEVLTILQLWGGNQWMTEEPRGPKLHLSECLWNQVIKKKTDAFFFPCLKVIACVLQFADTSLGTEDGDFCVATLRVIISLSQPGKSTVPQHSRHSCEPIMSCVGTSRSHFLRDPYPPLAFLFSPHIKTSCLLNST